MSNINVNVPKGSPGNGISLAGTTLPRRMTAWDSLQINMNVPCSRNLKYDGKFKDTDPSPEGKVYWLWC